eukprot:3236410-Pleurochrysis_carterae.AAC.1
MFDERKKLVPAMRFQLGFKIGSYLYPSLSSHTVSSLPTQESACCSSHKQAAQTKIRAKVRERNRIRVLPKARAIG